MAISNFLVEEALSLPAADRTEFARLLVDSLGDRADVSDDQIRRELKARLEDLKSGRDRGLSFEETFANDG